MAVLLVRHELFDDYNRNKQVLLQNKKLKTIQL